MTRASRIIQQHNEIMKSGPSKVINTAVKAVSIGSGSSSSIKTTTLNNFIKKPLVAIYVRVSTEEQAKEGISVDAQIDKCQSFCNAREWDIFRVYKDAGFSAGTLERPALELLLRDANERKFDIILVYKIDRFSRKLKDLIQVLEDLKEKHINFTSVTEQIDTTSAMGEAFFQIIGVFAQLERGMVKERVKLSFDRKADLGEALYRAPLGYIYKDKRLVVDLESSKKVRELFAMWVAGIDHKVISEKLDIPVSTLYTMIKNPIYIGKIRYKGELYPGKHPAIIDETLWNKIHGLVTDLSNDLESEDKSNSFEGGSERVSLEENMTETNLNESEFKHE